MLLLEEAIKGRRNSYINLSNIYIYSVFSIVFKLVPIKEEAIKISAETFLVTWRNLSKIETLKQFKQRLEQVAVLRCIDFLSNNKLKQLDKNEIEKLSKQFRNPISEIEKDILSLPTEERIVVVLSDQLGLTANLISRIYKGVQKKEIPEILNRTRKRLIITRPSEQFFKYTENDWIELFSSIKKIENFSILDLSPEQESIVKDYYEYSKELMQDLFMSILPNQEIKEILHNFILDEKISAAVKEVRVIAETEVVKTEKLVKKYNQKNFSGIHLPRPILFVLLLIVLLASGYLITNVVKFPATWKISGEFVHTEVNGSYSKTGELNSGDIINVGKSKTTIENSENTTVIIYANTELKLSEVSSSENIFELKNGKLKINTENSSAERYTYDGVKYILKTSSSILSTRNAQYIYKNVDYNSSFLDVLYGWVKITSITNKSTAYCVGGYAIDFEKSSKIIVPYKKSSTQEFINAVNYISKIPNDGDAFNFIIENSQEEDALTLWHLLEISDAYKKKILVEKFDELLLLNLKTETQNGTAFSEESKQSLLKFIRSTLLMRN